MKSPIVLAASATVFCGLTAFAVAQQSTGAAQHQSARGESAQMEEGPEHVQKCIQEASSDNQFEIQAGQFVEQKAQNPQVKELAQRLVQDHQRAEQQLMQGAGHANQTSMNQLMPVQQVMLDSLRQKQGEELERAFVFDQVGDHEKDILKAQWSAQHEKNAQLQQYAQKQIPVLEEHLRLARAAAEQFVPQARQAGERLPGTSGQNNSGINSNGATNGGTSGTAKPGATGR